MQDLGIKNGFIKFRTFLHTSLRSIFSYSSVVTAEIDNIGVGLIYRFTQIFILAYIIGYELLYKKGYQSFDSVTGTVTSKVKGFGLLPNDSAILPRYVLSFENGTLPPFKYKILDTADYVIPPNEFNSIFVMTSILPTEQSPGICEEDFTKSNANCTQDKDCLNVNSNNWNGVPTGRCINSTRLPGQKVCEVNAWCPVEFETKDSTYLVRNVVNYTIFIRNTVEFKSFNKKERNILASIKGDYIAKCAYQRHIDPSCPVFLIGDILNEAEEDEEERYNALRKGAIIEIKISWDCNYDVLTSHCIPSYSFERFDFSSKESRTVSGFNFRYADKYNVNGTLKRVLYKVYGLRFVINAVGRARKFNLVQLLLTLGACLGLLSISSLIADFVMLSCCVKKGNFHKMLTKNLDTTKQIDVMNYNGRIRNIKLIDFVVDHQVLNSIKQDSLRIHANRCRRHRFENNYKTNSTDTNHSNSMQNDFYIKDEVINKSPYQNGHKISNSVWITTDDYNEIVQNATRELIKDAVNRNKLKKSMSFQNDRV